MDDQLTYVGEKHRPIVPYLLLLPSFVLLFMFTFYPFVKTVVSSFAVTTTTGKFIRWAGLTNWKSMFRDPFFWEVFANTFKVAFLVLVFSFVTAMGLALLSSRVRRGSKLYQTLYALPMVIPALATSCMWFYIYRGTGGLLNSVLGTETAWLYDQRTAMVCVCIVIGWGHMASSYIFLMAGFRNVSQDVTEAATIDGANGLQKTFRIMLPLASPQIFYVLFTTTIGAFKTFTQLKVLTGGGPGMSTTTLMLNLVTKANTNLQMEAACCLSLVLFVIIFAVTRLQFFFEKKMVFYN